MRYAGDISTTALPSCAHPNPKDLSPAQFAEKLVHAMVAAHSTHPGLHRVLLDEAPSSDDYRNPERRFEVEYIAYYTEIVAAYRNRPANKTDHVAALVLSDAIDGVIHNAARRGALADPTVQYELARLASL